jgi:hypothetical protein
VVGIVDGYFDHQLSVWHKEVLWALSQGVLVYGAASMGALRAAELAAFGMIGVGRIFEDYQRGAIEADDEVAVAHAPSERDYLAVSEALVNVRATVTRATEEGVLDSPAAERLLRAGRAIFYPQRTYATLIARALEEGLPTASATTFRNWLGPRDERKVDQKKADALALLREIRRPRTASKAVHFHFEYSEVWHEFVRQLGEEPPGGTRPEVPPPEGLSVDTAQPETAQPEKVSLDAWCVALEQALALQLMSQDDVEVDEATVQAAADAFRRRHGLLTAEATQQWMDARGFDLETFSARMREQAGLNRFSEQARRLARAELAWLQDEPSRPSEQASKQASPAQPSPARHEID